MLPQNFMIFGTYKLHNAENEMISDCNPGIPGSRIPGSRTIFQSRNPRIQPPSIPGFRDY